MTGDEAPSPEARAMVGQGMNVLADVLRQLEPVTGPVPVTRFHSPPQDHCDEPMCPCGLPPAGAAPITPADPGDPEQGIAGWAAGHSSALITWRGWDGPARPEDPGLIQTWTRTATDERDVLMTLASFGHHDNVEVVGAWLLDGPAQAAPLWYHNGMAMTLRLPPEVEDQLKQVAATEHRSVQQTVLVAIEEYLSMRETTEILADPAALRGLAEARESEQAGDVVYGAEAARALLAERKR